MRIVALLLVFNPTSLTLAGPPHSLKASVMIVSITGIRMEIKNINFIK
ncbi:MAG TPA: hypothetical protein VF220_00250 [Nitrososphaeraceae archaeon]